MRKNTLGHTTLGQIISDAIMIQSGDQYFVKDNESGKLVRLNQFKLGDVKFYTLEGSVKMAGSERCENCDELVEELFEDEKTKKQVCTWCFETAATDNDD